MKSQTSHDCTNKNVICFLLEGEMFLDKLQETEIFFLRGLRAVDVVLAFVVVAPPKIWIYKDNNQNSMASLDLPQFSHLARDSKASERTLSRFIGPDQIQWNCLFNDMNILEDTNQL